MIYYTVDILHIVFMCFEEEHTCFHSRINKLIRFFWFYFESNLLPNMLNLENLILTKSGVLIHLTNLLYGGFLRDFLL